MYAGLFNTNFPCPLCNKLHAIRKCSRFVVMNVEKKLRIVSQLSLCYNCLAQSHSRTECRSIDRCRRCLQDHNTWLHPLTADRIWFPMTANILVRPRRDGTELYMRVLIDPTAARSTVMKWESDDLKCIVKEGRTIMTLIQKNVENRPIDIEFVVENKIYDRTPTVQIEYKDKYTYYDRKNKANADPHWFMSRRNQIILGADVMNQVLLGPIKPRPGHIYVQETVFGLAYFGEGIKNE